MATAISYSKTGTKHEAGVKLNSAVFEVEANHELVAQAYRTYLANGRVAGPKTLERGEVRGGGKKPWRQKGTGRARVGSSRVPNWRGGGVVFGPTGNENHTLTLPTKMKRLAIRQALSLKAAANQVAVIETFESVEGRVKPITQLLSKLGLTGRVLVVVPEKTDFIIRATRNIAGLEVVTATYLNVYTVMNADCLVVTTEALEAINGWLGEK